MSAQFFWPYRRVPSKGTFANDRLPKPSDYRNYDSSPPCELNRKGGFLSRTSQNYTMISRYDTVSFHLFWDGRPRRIQKGFPFVLNRGSYSVFCYQHSQGGRGTFYLAVGSPQVPVLLVPFFRSFELFAAPASGEPQQAGSVANGHEFACDSLARQAFRFVE